jgi:hypothetical protein
VVPVVVELPGGKTLTVRQMAEHDIAGLDALYEALSVDDTYRRFFSAFAARGFAPTWFARTRDQGFAIVAVADDGLPGARLVAEAGYVMLANGDAEFGITVAPDWRGWLGPYLLDVLVEVAAAKGIPNLEADILTENRPMQTLVRRRGTVTMGDSEDYTVVRVAIAAASKGRPSWPATPGRRRLLVEAQGGRWAHAADAGRAGFEVLTCGGQDARCPALDGQTCPLAEGADVIVVARPPSDPRTRSLIEAHKRLHPNVPVVVQRRAEDGASDSACSLLAGSTGAEVVATLRRAVGDSAPPEQ